MQKLHRRKFVRGLGINLFGPSILRFARGRADSAARINVTDFGVIPDITSDASVALRRAIAACPKSGGVLTFPLGTYRFSQVSGNAIELANFNNLEIDGGGSLFLLEGKTRAFAITDVQRLYLHDLNVDWNPTPFSEGIVTNVYPDNKTVEVLVEGATPIRTDFYLMLAFEQNTRLPQTITSDEARIPLPVSVSIIGGRLIKLLFDRPVRLAIGTPLAMLHTRESYGIIFGRSSDITLERINMYTAPGFAFAGTGVKNLTMKGCSVAPPAGSGRLLSSTADAFHFWGSRGIFRISQSTFSRNGDDCVNIHGFLLRARCSSKGECVLEKVNKVGNEDRPISEPMLPALNDEIDLLDTELFTPVGSGTVKGVQSEENEILLVSKLLPDPKKFVLLSDNDGIPRLEVTDCKFESSINRGILVHANAVIERNVFSNLGWAGVACSVDPTWLEGPLIANITIRKNIFRGCGRLIRGSLQVNTIVEAWQSGRGTPGDPMNHDISIEDNTFDDPLGTTIFVAETNDLSIKGNSILNARSRPDPLAPEVAIFLFNVRNTRVVANNSRRQMTIISSNTEPDALVVQNNIGLGYRHE